MNSHRFPRQFHPLRRNTDMTSTGGGEGTGSLEKALDVLELVTGAPDGLGQTEIAAKLALPRTTVYRLLATLVARGLLRRDPLRKVYRLGFRGFEMARKAFAAPDLVGAAVGELRALRDLTGETSYLAALDGLDVVSLERCDGVHSQRSAAAMGRRSPIYCTSQGKAILAFLDAPARDALVRDLVLKPLTPFTITDRRRLQAELRVSAARGYAIDDEEIVTGVRCVGAAVIDPTGKVRGAISVAGPAWRLTRERLELLGPEVAEAARRIGAQLPAAEPTGLAMQPLPGHWAFFGAFAQWCPQRSRFYWADVLAPALLESDGETTRELAMLDAPIAGLLFHGDEFVLPREQGALRLSADGAAVGEEPWPHGRTLAACNGPDDRFWVAMETAGGCAVGSVGRQGVLELRWQLSERVQSLLWHAPERCLYATAPDSGSILVLRAEGNAVRRLVTIPKGSGKVSGLAIDMDGGIWTALRDGWSVVRVSGDGNLDRVIGLPVPHPTDLAFGGEGLKRLIVVSARQPVPLDMLANAPLSGRVFMTQL
jgi:DNA-binding IclR family transcriptional regulator/sugar lactone lactonase YvrE